MARSSPNPNLREMRARKQSSAQGKGVRGANNAIDRGIDSLTQNKTAEKLGGN